MDNPEKRLAEALALTVEAMNCTDESHYERGETLLRKALELVPDNDIIVTNYVNFCLQIAQNNLVAYEKYDEAIIYFKKALEFSEGEADTWMDLGTAYANLDDPVETLKCWQKALKLLDGKKAEDRENIHRLMDNVRLVQKASEARQSRRGKGK